MGQLDLINSSQSPFLKYISSLLNFAKKVTLPLTSDLFDMLLSLLCGTKSEFLDFPEESTPTPRDKAAKLAKSSEKTVQNKTV
jgi:hypothetical protein